MQICLFCFCFFVFLFFFLTNCTYKTSPYRTIRALLVNVEVEILGIISTTGIILQNRCTNFYSSLWFCKQSRGVAHPDVQVMTSEHEGLWIFIKLKLGSNQGNALGRIIVATFFCFKLQDVHIFNLSNGKDSILNMFNNSQSLSRFQNIAYFGIFSCTLQKHFPRFVSTFA